MTKNTKADLVTLLKGNFYEANLLNKETPLKDLDEIESENWSTIDLETIPNFLLNDSLAGNPYYQVTKANRRNKDTYRGTPRTDFLNYKKHSEMVKDYDEDSYFSIIDNAYSTYAKRQQELGDDAVDEAQKKIHYNNKKLLLDRQAEFKYDNRMDKIYEGIKDTFYFPQDVVTALGKGAFDALSFTAGDVPIYGGRLINHIINTVGVDVLGNSDFFTSGRIKAEMDSTPDVENIYGEYYDPNSLTERIGAGVKGFQKESRFSPQGVRNIVEEQTTRFIPYRSSFMGSPSVRDTSETVADLVGLSNVLKNRFIKKGQKVQDKGDAFIDKIASLSEKSFRQTLKQDGVITALRYKSFLPRAEGYNYAYKAIQNNAEGAALMRRYNMGQLGFGVLVGTDHLLLNDFLSTTNIPTSDLPIVGEEGAIPLFTLDTPAILPLSYVASFGMNTFGNRLIDKAQAGAAHIQLAMKAFPLSPDPRFLTGSKFLQKKTTKDVMRDYIINVKRVNPEVADAAIKNIENYGKTIVVDRRGGKGNEYTVFDKLLDMWVQNVRGQTTANPLKQDGKLTVAYKSFDELMGYMNMSRQEINAIGRLVQQVNNLNETERNEVITQIEATSKLQEDIMGHFMTADENGVLQVKEEFSNPNRLGPNQKPLTVDDVLNFRMFVDDFITQGQVSELRNAIAKGADMNLLGSDLSSVLSNERLNILKQEENNLAALTKMHNLLLTTMPTENPDIENFMNSAGIVLKGYKENNIKEQSKLVDEIQTLQKIGELDMSGTPYPDLVLKVEQALGENIGGETLGSVRRFDNFYTKIVGKDDKGIAGRVNLGKLAREGNNAEIERILGTKKRGQSINPGLIGKAYAPVKNKKVSAVFPDLDQEELVSLNEAIQAARGNPIVRRGGYVIKNIAEEGQEPFYELNPNLKVDVLIAARGNLFRQQTAMLNDPRTLANASLNFGDKAGFLTELLEEVPGFEKANKTYRDLATPVNNYISDVLRQLTPSGEKEVTDYRMVGTFINFAKEDPELAAQYITGRHENDIGEIIPGFKIFGPKTLDIVTKGIAHQIEQGNITTSDFRNLSDNLFPLIFGEDAPKVGPITGAPKLVFRGKGGDLQSLIQARDALPAEAQSIISQYSGDLKIKEQEYADNIVNLDKILEGTVAGRGPKEETKFLDQLGTNREGMIQVREDFLRFDPGMTESQYNASVMTLVSEKIYEDLASVSVEGVKPPSEFLPEPQIKISPTENIFPIRPTSPKDKPLRQKMDDNQLTFEKILTGQVDQYSAIVKKYTPIIQVHGTKEQRENLTVSEQVRDLMQVITTPEKGGRILNIPEPLPLKTLLSMTNSYMRQVIGGRWFFTMLGINSYRNKNARFLTNILMNPVSRDTIAKLTEGKPLSEEEIPVAENLLFAILPNATQLGYLGDEAAKKDEELKQDFSDWFNKNVLNKFK